MLSRIVTYSSVLRRPREASRLVQRAQASSKGSSVEVQAGEAGLEWRVKPWKVLAGGAALIGVGFASVAREVHTTAAAQGRQLDRLEQRLEQLRVDLPAGLNGVAERLEKSIAAGHGELRRNADENRSDPAAQG